ARARSTLAVMPSTVRSASSRDQLTHGARHGRQRAKGVPTAESAAALARSVAGSYGVLLG
ncbi:hypothetical protein ABZ154_28385, partial [Streptomyces sp. NPDC006261]|uniref:hypothetical protein n=1 Tax=Streptomyces sp. NPDC006261 TaxID=3156739 RepID=UPI0033B654AF